MSSSKAGPNLGTREILDLLQADLEAVEREVGLESVASVEAVTTISHYLQNGGGKRLRPILVLLVARMLGNGADSAIRMAAVVEMIHCATLIHDDVIDDAKTRRGRPSANVLWGNQRSVLAGDWLYMQAFNVALKERNFQILDLLINLTQLMVEGELLQLERTGQLDITEADYMELVHRKTASLFSTCARLGAMVSHAGELTETRLGEFAWNLGMAFQLVDDILDFTSNEATLGKPVGSDLREGKLTLPVIYAMERASAQERQLIETVVRDGGYQRVSLAEVIDLIERHGGLQRARERAQAFADKAREAILQFPESPFQKALQHVTEIVTQRDH